MQIAKRFYIKVKSIKEIFAARTESLGINEQYEYDYFHPNVVNINNREIILRENAEYRVTQKRRN